MRAVLVLLGACATVVSLAAQSPTPPTHSVRGGIYTTTQAERGAATYASHCASCHATDLLGFSPTRLAKVPPLVGPEFVSDWTDMRVSDLFMRIRSSMPQQAPGTLRREQVADILAFVLQVNAYPAGDRELPPTEPLLSDIRFER